MTVFFYLQAFFPKKDVGFHIGYTDVFSRFSRKFSGEIINM